MQSKGLAPHSLERATRIELAFSAWEADVLPLNYARTGSMVSPPQINATRSLKSKNSLPVDAQF